MGCCFSRPSGPNSPYPAAQSATSRNITTTGTTTTTDNHHHLPPLSPLPSPATATASTSPRRHRRRPLAQHITKPLRRHVWTSTTAAAAPTSSASTRAWTREALDRERAAFFDTRVTGRVEVWQTVRAALEVLWAADATRRDGGEHDDDREEEEEEEEQDGAVALATAQSILTAAGVTLPTGDLADGVYDGLGNWYQLPEYVVADPLDIAEEETGEAKDGGDDDDEDEDDDDEDDEVRRQREEKGKGVLDRRAQIGVVVRFSDGAKDLKLLVGKEEAVRSIVRRIREETGQPPTTRIRLVYFGKILRDNGTLLGQGWTKGNVLSAFVYDAPR